MKNDKMMKRVSVIVGGIVLVAAGACAWAFYNHGGGGDPGIEDGPRPRPLEERAVKRTVVYAAKDIEEGAMIAPDDLEEQSLAESKIPESAVSSQSMAAGSFAAVNIAQGTIILSGHLKHTSGGTLKTKPAAKPKTNPPKKHG